MMRLENTLREEFRFLSEANRRKRTDVGRDDGDGSRTIAARTWELDGKKEPLLSPDEVENLNIRQGTLSAKEREIIQNHATMTYKILSQLPFPKKLRHVPDYAAAHHETLNGRGYPRGLNATQLSLQSRILALADVFEALTAKDRPYREGENPFRQPCISWTMMVKDGHIDPDLFALFQKEGIPLDYARREMSPAADRFRRPRLTARNLPRSKTAPRFASALAGGRIVWVGTFGVICSGRFCRDHRFSESISFLNLFGFRMILGKFLQGCLEVKKGAVHLPLFLEIETEVIV